MKIVATLRNRGEQIKLRRQRCSPGFFIVKRSGIYNFLSYFSNYKFSLHISVTPLAERTFIFSAPLMNMAFIDLNV